MEKNKTKVSMIKGILCVSAFCTMAMPASITPALSVPEVMDPGMIQQQIMMEGGSNYKHNLDTLEQQRYRQDYNNEYQQYERRRESLNNPSRESQIIQNYNPNASFMQGQVQDIDTKGVYVNSIEVAPSEILSKEEIDKIVRPLIGRNVFIGDITDVVNQINNLYATKGFVTARAFLPEQTVSNGHIYIDLIESKVGNITVKENKYTRSKYITDRLPQKKGDLFDIVELEKDILDFNRYNEGVNLTANLKAGEVEGTTDIEVTAHENFPFHLVGVFDNAGRYTTGSLRGGAMIFADSLFHNRDRLSIGTYFSGGSISPFADYNIPINKKDGRIGFMFASSLAKIRYGALEDLNLKSKSYQYSLYYTQPLVRKPGFELKSYLAANYKRARTTMGPISGLFDDELEMGLDEVTSLDLALNMRKDTKYGIWYLNQGIGYAIPILDSDSDYLKISGGVVRLHDFSHGVIGQLRGNYQVIPNNKHIPYIDQFQAGGMATVRGYSEGLMIGKNGYYLSAELMFPLLPREITSPRSGEKIPFIGKYVKGAIFADHGGVFPSVDEDYYGAAGSSGASYFMTSIGMGLRVQLPGDLSARLYWGYPLINHWWETDHKYGRFHFELTMEPNFDALLRGRHKEVKAQPAPPPPSEPINNYDDIRHYDYFNDGGGGSL